MFKSKQILLSIVLLALVGGLSYFIYTSRQPAKIAPLMERKGTLSLSGEWKNTKRAIEGLQEKIRRNPQDYTSKLLLVYGFMQEARVTGEHPYYYPACLDLVEDILGHTQPKDPIYAKALVAKASVELSLHHFAEALETGKTALKTNEGDKDLYGVLCDANVELGRYDDAVAMADKMVSIRPDLQSYSRVSYLREIHGDLPGAIAAMEMAAKAGYPGLEQTCWVRYNLGKLYEKKGDTSMARQEYELILAQNMHYAFAIGGMAHLAAKAKKYPEALGLYARALDMMPEFSFQEEMARIYVDTKDPRAKEAIEKTLAMLKEDQDAGHDANLELANLHLTLDKDYDKALEYADKEYEKRPLNIDVNRSLALIHAQLGHKTEAAKYAGAALRTKKADPELAQLMVVASR